MGLIQIALLLAFFNFGLHLATRQGGVLGFISKLTTNDGNAYSEILNPLIECPSCMSSFWGVLSVYYLGWIDWHVLAWFIGSYACILAIDLLKGWHSVLEKLYLVSVVVTFALSNRPIDCFILLFVTYGISVIISTVYNRD